jgi:hypothetical protein
VRQLGAPLESAPGAPQNCQAVFSRIVHSGSHGSRTLSMVIP